MSGVVEVRGRKPRAVLAMLLLHPNEPVSQERLAIALGEDAPAAAVKTVQVHVSRLRKALGNQGIVSTTPAGYCLRVRPGWFLDVERFEQLAADGLHALAAGQPERAATLLRDALDLWRGPALEDLAYDSFAQADIARLQERRNDRPRGPRRGRAAAGHHGELVGELRPLVADHPTREALTASLMLALYRSGRQPEALAAYRTLREALVEEIGGEPGVEVRALYDAMLRQDPSLRLRSDIAQPALRDEGPVAQPPVPQVAPRTRDGAFVGREAVPRAAARAMAGVSGGADRRRLPRRRGRDRKTRLASRFAQEAHRDGGAVLYGRADVDALLPYQPFAEALNRLIDHDDGELAAVLEHELSVLSHLFPRLRARRHQAAWG